MSPVADDDNNTALSAESASEQALEPSDRSLLRRFRNGSQDAALQLYLRYAHRLHALTRRNCPAELAPRIDIEDIVQSVFRSFFSAASRGCYDVPDGEELWKLLLVIALNKIRDKGSFHRAPQRDVRLTRGGDSLDQSDGEPAINDETPYVFLQMVIDETLKPLPPVYKRIIELRIEGHDVAQIAQLVGRSKRTVERALQEFRENLRMVLQEEE
jgi:RNA polymerase sigma-70 factor (ECF subfamily)